jgi:hypothetical protein
VPKLVEPIQVTEVKKTTTHVHSNPLTPSFLPPSMATPKGIATPAPSTTTTITQPGLPPMKPLGKPKTTPLVTPTVVREPKTTPPVVWSVEMDQRLLKFVNRQGRELVVTALSECFPGLDAKEVLDRCKHLKNIGIISKDNHVDYEKYVSMRASSGGLKEKRIVIDEERGVGSGIVAATPTTSNEILLGSDGKSPGTPLLDQ